jgi:hypothetical protein
MMRLTASDYLLTRIRSSDYTWRSGPDTQGEPWMLLYCSGMLSGGYLIRPVWCNSGSPSGAIRSVVPFPSTSQ